MLMTIRRSLAARALLAPAVLLAAASARVAAQAPPDSAHPFGTLREQAQRQQAWLRQRLDSILPGLMRKYGIDMWVVPMREYNEDPVFPAIVSPTTFAARRRTIYVFFDRGRNGVERRFGSASGRDRGPRAGLRLRQTAVWRDAPAGRGAFASSTSRPAERSVSQSRNRCYRERMK